MALSTDFKSFDVSTKTFIVYTNLSLDVEEIFNNKILPITPYTLVQKKRGRKKNTQAPNPNENITNGSVICVQYRDKIHGVKLKKTKKPSDKFFRNSLTVTIFIDKFVNFKTSRSGKFQLTGCKTVEQAEQCVLHFWKYIIEYPSAYTLKNSNFLTAYYDPVMYNIDFSLNFKVNRENLDVLINTTTPYTSLLETTFGYTGVNIKFPVKPLSTLKIYYKEYSSVHPKTQLISYEEFRKIAKPKKLPRYNTFLVFQSGKVIMSGKTSEFMEDAYCEFLDIIKKSKHIIAEELI